MSTQPGFQASEQRRGQIVHGAENQARYASSFVTVHTSGWGEFQSPNVRRCG